MSVSHRRFRQFLRPDRLASAAYLAGLLVLALYYMRPLVFRTWFFYWDEYVIAAEVMRFSGLDFRQHFFDIPGTPFMMLDALVWRIFYASQRALGSISPEIGIGLFTYRHLPQLFTVMRSTTLAFFLLTPVLLFWLCAKLTNKSTAAIASLLLVLSPVYCLNSSFARTESLAMALILGALIWLNRGIERAGDDFQAPPGIRDYATVAGILAGVAAGARLHSMTAALPVLAITLWLNKPVRQAAYPDWILRSSRYVLPAVWAAAVFILIYMRAAAAEFPAAVRLFSGAALLAMGISGAAFLLYRLPRMKPLVVRILSPDHCKLVLGVGVGLVLSNATVFAQREHFFRSIQMYSTYLDRDRLAWPFFKNLVWYIRYYLDRIVPERLSFDRLYYPPVTPPDVHLDLLSPDRLPLLLLGLGCIAIVAARDRRILPYLLAAVLFFVSKPLNLFAAHHHVILWLPFFFIVCAYPVGKFCQFLSRLRYGSIWTAGALACMLYFSINHLAIGPWVASVQAQASETRMRNIEHATAWIKTHAEPKASVAISMYCFNPDVFYGLMNYMQVPLPREAFDGRDYLIWWGNANALQGKTGYACATRADVPWIKTRIDLAEPGQGTDPYTDRRFTPVASFGSRIHQVDLFRFDYR